jgi:hypothetical protein
MPYDLPRIPLPTDASSADLSRLPVAIRQQGLFSARLNTMGPLAQIGSEIQGILSGSRDESEARRDIRAALRAAGYQPPAGTEGGLRDHTSKTRLDLILQQNVRSARGYGKWAADMDPISLDLWPAQELIRIMARRVPRGDWKRRWVEAGGRLYGGRMIALKTDPVWVNLNRFGVPYPPYDYGSGMGVLDIDRDEAVKLGLIGEIEKLTPEPVPFPETSEFSLPDLAAMPDLQASILKVFGGGAKIDGGVLSIGPSWALPAPGDSKSFGTGPLSDSTVTPPPAYVDPGEARRLISTGQAVAGSPGSKLIKIGDSVERHWINKGYTQAEIENRLRHIRQAIAAVQEPQEVWDRPDGIWYLREFVTPEGSAKRILVQTNLKGQVVTWIPTNQAPRYFDNKRAGALLKKEGA